MATISPPYTSDLELINNHGALGLLATHLKEADYSLSMLKNEFMSPSPSPSPSPESSHNNQAHHKNVTGSPFINPSQDTLTSVEKSENGGNERRVSIFDVLLAMMDRLAGKDKMAKVGQYSLRLVLFYCARAKNYISSDQLNLDVINSKYSSKRNLLVDFARNPRKFIKVVILLLVSILDTKLSGVVKGLSMYRQFLRFGKTPFRLTKVSKKLYDSIRIANKATVFDFPGLVNQWSSLESISELVNLYYGVFDEILLLYKLGFFSNGTLRKLAGRHESLSWYYEIIIGLYKNSMLLSDLKQKEFEIKIEKRVKNKAKYLSRQLFRQSTLNNHSSPLRQKISFSNLQSDNERIITDQELDELKEIKDLKYQQYLVKLDIGRLTCDFVFDSFDVWSLKLPFGNLQILLGICSSSLAVTKIFNDVRNSLQK